MHYLKILNKTVKYIERNLKANIDIKEFLRDSSFSYDAISRLFSTLAGITLVKYIRVRRLSEAAKDISITQKKIIDIAYSYGYDSADSFGYAFKKQHGITPTAVRKGANYKYFLPLQFQSSVEGGRDIAVEVEYIKVFTISAYQINLSAKTIIKENRFPIIWTELIDKLKPVIDINKINLYEIYDFDDDGNMVYYVGCEQLSDKLNAKLGLQPFVIPSFNYAVFTVEATEIRAIKEPFKYIRTTFFNGENDVNTEVPDFICHKIGDRKSKDYEAKLCIAVEKS